MDSLRQYALHSGRTVTDLAEVAVEEAAIRAEPRPEAWQRALGLNAEPQHYMEPPAPDPSSAPTPTWEKIEDPAFIKLRDYLSSAFEHAVSEPRDTELKEMLDAYFESQST